MHIAARAAAKEKGVFRMTNSSDRAQKWSAARLPRAEFESESRMASASRRARAPSDEDRFNIGAT
jgi:hypothetical protein